jgi:O-antigen/teichoic acid export membrane protein
LFRAPRRSTEPQARLGRLEKKSQRRAIWSALDASATPLASLLIAAGLVRTLGAEEYGLIVVALAISGLSNAVNPAIAATTTKFVSEATGAGSTQRTVGRIIGTSLISVAAIDLLLITVAFVFGRPLSLLMFGPHTVAVRSNISTILLLAVASVCVQQIDGVCAAALKGLERFRQQAIMEICSRGTLVISVILCGWATRDSRIVLLTYCCVCALSTVARACILKAATGTLHIFALPGKPDFMKLLRFGSWMWLNAIATIAYSTVDRILVGRVSGPAAAAEFSVYVQFAQLVHFIPASLFGFTFPVFSRLGADKVHNLAEIKHLYRLNTVRAVSIGLVVAIGMLICLPALQKAFGGSFRQQHDLAFALLLLGYLILTANVVPYYLSLGLGSSRAVSLITSISMFASISLTLALTPTFGVMGAAIARLAYGIGAMALLFVAQQKLRSQ